MQTTSGGEACLDAVVLLLDHDVLILPETTMLGDLLCQMMQLLMQG